MACQMRLGTWKVTVVMDDFLQWPMTDIIVPSETDDTHKLSYEFSGYPGFDMTTLTYMAPVGTVHLEHIPSGRQILVDAGAVPVADGPVAEKLLARMARVGIERDRIEAVVVTHAHGDHIGALLDIDSRPTFPNATVLLSRAEKDAWFSDNPHGDFAGDKDKHRHILGDGVRQCLNTLDTLGRLVLSTEDQEVIPGVRVLHGFEGHTAGMSVVEVAVAADGISNIYMTAGLFAHPVQLRHLTNRTAFDHDPKAAVLSRARFLPTITNVSTLEGSSGKAMNISTHFPFPGVGMVEMEPTTGHLIWSPISASDPRVQLLQSPYTTEFNRMGATGEK